MTLLQQFWPQGPVSADAAKALKKLGTAIWHKTLKWVALALLAWLGLQAGKHFFNTPGEFLELLCNTEVWLATTWTPVTVLMAWSILRWLLALRAITLLLHVGATPYSPETADFAKRLNCGLVYLETISIRILTGYLVFFVVTLCSYPFLQNAEVPSAPLYSLGNLIVSGLIHCYMWTAASARSLELLDLGQSPSSFLKSLEEIRADTPECPYERWDTHPANKAPSLREIAVLLALKLTPKLPQSPGIDSVLTPPEPLDKKGEYRL